MNAIHPYLDLSRPKTDTDFPIEDAAYPGHPDFGKTLKQLFGEEGAKRYQEEHKRRVENLNRFLKVKRSSGSQSQSSQNSE